MDFYNKPKYVIPLPNIRLHRYFSGSFSIPNWLNGLHILSKPHAFNLYMVGATLAVAQNRPKIPDYFRPNPLPPFNMKGKCIKKESFKSVQSNPVIPPNLIPPPIRHPHKKSGGLLSQIARYLIASGNLFRYATIPYLGYTKKPRPVLRPRYPACTIFQSSGQGRYLESENPLYSTSIIARQTSNPIKSASVRGPIG
jgi:hypothetical protein